MNTHRRITVLFWLLIAVFQVTEARAVCGEGEYKDDEAVLSLTQGLELNQPGGDAISIDYLELLRHTGTEVGNEIQVERLDGSAIGLVDRRQVAVYRTSRCFSRPLKSSDYFEQGEEADSPLELKVLLSNNPRSPDREQYLTSIPIRNAPSESAEIIDDIGFFSIFPVFGYYYSEVNYEGWFFIGDRHSEFEWVRNEDDRGNIMLGWVRDKDVIVWPQRQAVFPRTGDLPVISSDGALGREQAALFRFVDEAKRDRVKIKAPLLRQIMAGDPMEVYEIAIVSEGGIAVDSGDKVQLFSQWLESADHIDMLFVLDNTESMISYRKPTLEAIGAAISSFDERNKSRFAFAMYGDDFASDVNASKWFSEREVSSTITSAMKRLTGRKFQFQLENFVEFEDLLDDEQFEQVFGGSYSDEQRDRQEAGLSALALAIDQASWRPDTSQRLVFFLGDDHDRSYEGGSQTQSSIELVANLAREKGVLIVPINLAGRAVDYSNKLWIQQVNLLRKKMNDGRTNSGFLGAVAKTFKGYDEDTADTEMTRDRVEALLVEILSLGSAIDELHEDFFRQASEATDTIFEIDERLPTALIFEEAFRAWTGGTRDDIARKFSEAPFVFVGSVPAEGVDDFVALTPYELGKLRNGIDIVCTNMNDRQRFREVFDDLAAELAEAFTGDRWGDQYRYRGADSEAESIQEFFRRILFLPAEYFSIFGDRTVDEFVRDVIGGKEKKRAEFLKIQREICTSAELMRRVEFGRFADRDLIDHSQDEYDDDRGVPKIIFKEERNREYSWLWQVPGGENRYYFVPSSFFPQENNEQ